jgi:uncharacterized membrane protein
MDLLPLHPKVVHLPIALAVLMPVLSAGLLAAWWQGLLPRRAWMIAVLLQGLLLVSGVVSLQTGQSEEDRVERFVAERLIEQHEEAAETFVWGAGGVFLLALAAAAVRNDLNARRVAMATTLGTLLVIVLGYRVGEAGGRLVYEHGAANAYVTPHATSSTRARRGE